MHTLRHTPKSKTAPTLTDTRAVAMHKLGACIVNRGEFQSTCQGCCRSKRSRESSAGRVHVTTTRGHRALRRGEKLGRVFIFVKKGGES